MKVKVRKRNPAPVKTEQDSKTIDVIKDEFDGNFGVPKKVILERRAPIISDRDTILTAIEEVGKIKEKIRAAHKEYAFLDGKAFNGGTISDMDISHYCNMYYLTEIPLSMLTDYIASNIYVKEDGSRALLIPSLWVWFHLA